MSWDSFFSCICVIFLALFCSGEQTETFDENDTITHLLPAYTIASRAELVNSTICRKELRNFRNAVDHRILWSIKVLDSSGGPKPGFIYGNKFWLGIYSQCLDTMNTKPFDLSEREIQNNTLYRNPREEFPPFEVNYFVAYFKHNSTLQYHVKLPNEDLITLGLCLPASCSTKDLGFILETIFRDRILLFGDLYSADFRLVEVKVLKDDYQWLLSWEIIFIGFVLALSWTLMIIGTMYDIFVYQKYLKAKNFCTYDDSRSSSLKKSNGDTIDSKDAPELTSLSPHEKSKIGRVLMCFSVYTNTKNIFNTKLTTHSIPAIHGLKFLSMILVIMSHTAVFPGDTLDNIPWGLRLTENYIINFTLNGHFVVDTYFFLSGFLLTYIFLREAMNKIQTEPINYTAILYGFFDIVANRFIRLTPAYMMTIGITYLGSSWHSKNSQFYITEKQHELCAKYWWKNLLYINNLFDFRSTCICWTWYLANDMQFFIIGLILLILSAIYFYTAVVILCTLLIGSTIFTAYISYVNNFVPVADEAYRLVNELYLPPWIRIGPHIIGIIAAYITRMKVNQKFVLKRRTLILCWCLGSFCNLSVVFGLYDRHISVLATAFYLALSRTVWAIGLAWMLLACVTNHGGIINQLLSFRGWIPLSRLSYCAFLIHPLIIVIIHLQQESSTHLNFLAQGTEFFGILMISYFCAYVLSLMFEAPYILLMRIFDQSYNVKVSQMRDDKFRMIALAKSQ